jgi:hypothetical protein
MGVDLNVWLLVSAEVRRSRVDVPWRDRRTTHDWGGCATLISDTSSGHLLGASWRGNGGYRRNPRLRTGHGHRHKEVRVDLILIRYRGLSAVRPGVPLVVGERQWRSYAFLATSFHAVQAGQAGPPRRSRSCRDLLWALTRPGWCPVAVRPGPVRGVAPSLQQAGVEKTGRCLSRCRGLAAGEGGDGAPSVAAIQPLARLVGSHTAGAARTGSPCRPRRWLRRSLIQGG